MVESTIATAEPSPADATPGVSPTALAEVLGNSLADFHAGRVGRTQRCGYCHAPKGEPCMFSPLPGPVVELEEPRPLTTAGIAAGWAT